MRLWLAPCAALIAASVAVAGCGSSSNNSSSSASSSPSSATSPGVATAEQQVASLSSMTASYPVPTGSVSGVKKLKGQTVYYIPLVQQIPGFVVTAATMKQAIVSEM